MLWVFIHLKYSLRKEKADSGYHCRRMSGGFNSDIFLRPLWAISLSRKGNGPILQEIFS